MDKQKRIEKRVGIHLMIYVFLGLYIRIRIKVAPVCDTLMGKGAYDGTSENYTGMLGMHGTKTSNLGVSECDLLIAVGVRFSDRVLGNPKKFAKQAKILQIDIDPVEINKNIIVNHSIIGDVAIVLGKLNEKLEQQKHTEWLSHIADYQKMYPMTIPKEGLSGPFMIAKIYEMAKDAIMVTEVGRIRSGFILF